MLSECISPLVASKKVSCICREIILLSVSTSWPKFTNQKSEIYSSHCLQVMTNIFTTLAILTFASTCRQSGLDQWDRQWSSSLKAGDVRGCTGVPAEAYSSRTSWSGWTHGPPDLFSALMYTWVWSASKVDDPNMPQEWVEDCRGYRRFRMIGKISTRFRMPQSTVRAWPTAPTPVEGQKN